jgi:hypothetical protein
MPPRRRINIYFTEDASRALEEVVMRSGRSQSAVLSEAIKLQRWFTEVRAQGGHVFVETASGSVREVVTL